MLIGIDASRAVRARRTGTETYALHLIRGLLELGLSHRYRLYFNQPPSPELIPPGPHWEPRVMPFPRLWTHVRLSWEMARRPPDVLFVPAHVLPIVRPRRTVVTVHDLGYRHYPAAHRSLDRFYLDLSTRYHVRAASHILADSQATRNDLVGEYGADPARITVVYPGVDKTLRHVDDSAAIAAVREKYGIHGEYVLYVGTLHPRKNLVRLIEAFSLLKSGVKLVIAGQKGWLYDRIFARVQELGIEQRAIFTGYVADADLPALLSGARVFAFPSLYEGFGLPVLEAMACGVPVVCSNVSSLPEVAGDAALLVDPLDTGAWVAALERALTDEELRAELIRRGYAQVRRFSWRRAAEETLKVLERVGQTSKVYKTREKRRGVRILGVWVDDVTYEEMLARLDAFIAAGGAHQVATMNPEFVIAAHRDAEFRAALDAAALCLPDGVGLLWAGRLLGHPLRQRVTGSDGIWHIAELAARRGYRLFLLGAAPGVAEEAARRLCDQYPGLVVASTYAGSPAAEEESAIVERIRNARADILLVAYGHPRQEKWLARNLVRSGAAVGLGVGGAFDFVAGVAVRAPRWMRRLGLEWLYRLWREPWRWQRMLALPQFAALVLWEWLTSRETNVEEE